MQTIAVTGTLVAIFGAAATYHVYMDDKKYDVHLATITHEQLQLAQTSQLIKMQVIAKESRLADIDAELNNIAYRLQVGKAYRTDDQRRRQLLEQRGAIVQHLETLK